MCAIVTWRHSLAKYVQEVDLAGLNVEQFISAKCLLSLPSQLLIHSVDSTRMAGKQEQGKEETRRRFWLLQRENMKPWDDEAGSDEIQSASYARFICRFLAEDVVVNKYMFAPVSQRLEPLAVSPKSICKEGCHYWWMDR